jgi:hypothetical protein
MSQYDLPKGTVFIIDLDLKNSPKATVYGLSTGNIAEVKVQKKLYNNNPFQKNNVVQFTQLKKKPKVKYVDGRFEPIDGFDVWGENYVVIQQNNQIQMQ